MTRYLAVCLCLLPLCSAAQQDRFHLVAITGHVTDSGSGEPIPFVRVEVEGSTVGPGSTDFDGFYLIRPNVRPGRYFVRFSAGGYIPSVLPFEVYRDKWTVRSVVLQALPR